MDISLFCILRSAKFQKVFRSPITLGKDPGSNKTLIMDLAPKAIMLYLKALDIIFVIYKKSYTFLEKTFIQFCGQFLVFLL